MEDLQKAVEQAWEKRELLNETEFGDAIRKVVDNLDKGRIRVAEYNGSDWRVNEWVKKAVILYFPLQKWKRP